MICFNSWAMIRALKFWETTAGTVGSANSSKEKNALRIFPYAFCKSGFHGRAMMYEIIRRVYKRSDPTGFAVWGYFEYTGETCTPSPVRDDFQAENKS